MYEYGSIIQGKQVISTEWLEVHNPYSGELVGRVASVDRETTEKVLSVARNSKFRLQRFERADLLNRMAASLQAEAGNVSRMITAESGLSLKDTAYEVQRACDVLRFTAINTLQDDSQVFPCDVSATGRQRRIYTSREPLGVIAAITPFNHPLNQVVHKIAPAIATNNATVLKPSQITPLSAYYLVQLATECGMPPGMVNVISGPTSGVAEPIVASRLVDMITFTGSTATGKRIASVAGYKRLVLELGGSSAMLVLPDADPVAAARIAAAGIFKNSGQRCTAIRRLLVHESLAGQFGQALSEIAEDVVCGDPFDPKTDMGTVISEASAVEIERRVQLSVDRGARVLAGGVRRGALYTPAVLDNVQNDFPVVTCETFGPIAPIIRFKTLDEAIAIANNTEFGLSGAVVSDHWPSIQRVISELETGTVNVNEAPSFRLEWSPFGGIKSSGLGYKEGVIEAMKSMTYVKTYSLPWDRP